MHIALASETPWTPAAIALGHKCTVIAAPSTTSRRGQTMAQRAAWGEHAIRRLQADPAELILDTNGEALWFAPDPDGQTDLVLVNDMLGIPHVTHFTRPIYEAFDGMPWGHVWNCLQSRTWVKACADAAQAAELSALGVPNVVYLPAGATDADYPPAETATPPDSIAIGCLHVDHGPFFTGPTRVAATSLLPGVMAQSSAGLRRRHSFFDLFFNTYAFDPRPSPTSDQRELTRVATRYFATKPYYTSQLGIGEHARFVRFLRVRFGELVNLLGAPSPDGAVEGSPSLADAVRFCRGVAINIGLNFNRAEQGPDHRLFEIAAAGGLLLAHRNTRITDFLAAGEECEVFDHEGDLLEKIQLYLEVPERRMAIAAAGQRRVLDYHLLSHRLQLLLTLPEVQAVESAPETVPVAASPPQGEPDGVIAARSVPTRDVPVMDRGALGPNGEPVGRLLMLMNPGRMSRNWLQGIGRGAERIGIQTCVLELSQTWRQRNASPEALARSFEASLTRDRVVAAIGYTGNGCLEFQRTRDAAGREQTLLCRAGVPHLMFWSDHPHWAHEEVGLQDAHQALLQHPSHHHFLKSGAAAAEIRDVLQWPNVYGMSPGEDTERLRPAPRRDPEFDVVCIVGSPPAPLEELEPLLAQDEPDVGTIEGIMAGRATARLRQVLDAHVPADARPQLDVLAVDWIEAKRSDPLTAAYRHFVRLAVDHPAACAWLREHPAVYFAAIDALWEFGRWQRTFMLRYLAKTFRVGVFGHDWSSVGLGGGDNWVDYDRQPEVYARGKVGLSISQCGDEEGVAHKPFEITACGVACVHMSRRGLDALFTPGREIALFDTPAEARQVIADLCRDDARRFELAEAGRARTVRDHSWSTRVGQMLSQAGLVPETFGLTSWDSQRRNAASVEMRDQADTPPAGSNNPATAEALAER